MITEKLLKSKKIIMTGRVKYRRTKRIRDNRSKEEYCYILLVEIETNDEVEFHSVSTVLNEVKEFASMSSIEKFINRLDRKILSGAFYVIEW